MSSNNCIGVNMVILFDKRVRYVKEVKNHCLSHINSELQGFGVTRSGFEPCLPVSVERALFRRVRLVSRLKHRFSSLRYGPTWNRTPPTRFGGLRTSSLDGRNVAHHANWRLWKGLPSFTMMRVRPISEPNEGRTCCVISRGVTVAVTQTAECRKQF